MKTKGEINTKVLIALLVVLIGLVGYFGYTLFFKKPDVLVPNFKNMNETEIVAWAKENSCAENIVIKYEFSEEIEKGAVIYQSIKENEKLEDVLYITISDGPNPDKEMNIDYDENTTIEGLEAWFKENGFKNYELLYEDTDEYEEGHIIDVNPKMAKKADLIVVRIAAHTTTTIKVPDFSNSNKNEIDIWGQKNKIQIVYTYKSSKEKEDAVIGQKPEANSEISKGDKVTITLSSGSAKSNTIPGDWLGIAESDFIAKLKDLGFTKLKKDTQTYFSVLSAKSTIFSYDDGTFPLTQTINYAISEGKYYDIFSAKDYEGKTLDEAHAVVKGYNDRNAHIMFNYTELVNKNADEGTLFNCTATYSKPNTYISCKLTKNDGGSDTPGEEDDPYATLPTNLLGVSETDFIKTCNSLGFNDVVRGSETLFSTTSKKGSVGAYDPDGYLLKITKITYYLSLGAYYDNFTANDYNGKTEAQAKSTAQNYNNMNAHISLSITSVETNDHEADKLYDCSVSHSGTQSTVSCKLAKAVSTPSVTKKYLMGSDMIQQLYSASSLNETKSNLRTYFSNNGFTNITYKEVTSDLTVGQIVSVTINGSTFKGAEYDVNTAIVVEICSKTE